MDAIPTEAAHAFETAYGTWEFDRFLTLSQGLVARFKIRADSCCLWGHRLISTSDAISEGYLWWMELQ